MIYFALNTNKKKIGKLKMSKLLFALDFEHFKNTGRSVTGIKYYAYPLGPYPKNELEKINDKEMPPDLSHFMSILPMYEEDGEEKGYLFKTKHGTKPNLSLFSNRELKIMQWLAEVFYDASGEQMKNWSHQRGTPWQRVWQIENRPFEEIAYTYAVDDSSPITKDEAEELLKEENEFDSLFPAHKDK